MAEESGWRPIESAQEAIGVAGTLSPATYEPDPRDDPAWWTVGRFQKEARPRLREDGSGGSRRLWVACQACGTRRTTDLGHITKVATPIGAITFRCECGGLGKPSMTWVNPPRPQSEAEKLTGQWRVHRPRPRPGSFDFETGKRVGAWD